MDPRSLRFDPGLSGTITLSSDIVIDKDVVIQGPGRDVITISGGNATRHFDITSAWRLDHQWIDA